MALGRDFLIDESLFQRARVELGSGFVRVLGYFRDDGFKSVAALEQAIGARDAASMVMPAYSLKSDARQFGATPLAALAERIERVARDCVERHGAPDRAQSDVIALRPLFEKTLERLEREGNPLVERRRADGRHVA